MKSWSTFFALSSFIFLFAPWTGFAASDGSIELDKNLNGPLTLKQAIALTLMHSPKLEAHSFERRAREARALQSGLLPNPQLEVEVEDAAGSGNFSGFDQAQTTIQLSQLIELGGKRAARLRASQLSIKLADWDYETQRVDVLTEVSKAYIELLKFQQKVSLAEDLVHLGEKFLSAVDERVKSGKTALLESTKAEVTLSSMRVELEKAKRALEAGRRNLSVA